MKYEIGDMIMVPAKVVGIHRRENWAAYDVEIMNAEPSYDGEYFTGEYSYKESFIIGKYEEA